MSPRTTLSSSGSSSTLVRRRNRPSAVRRSASGSERAVGAAPVGHGAELRHLERSPVASRTHLAEQHRRAHAHAHEHRDDGQQRRQHARARPTRRHVDDALQRVVTAHGTSRPWRAARRGARSGTTSGNSSCSRVESACECRTSPARRLDVLDGERRAEDRLELGDRASSRSVRVPNARFTGVGVRDPARDGVGDHLGDGVDVGEVAALLAVAVHDERTARRARPTRTRAPPRRRRGRRPAAARTR